MGIAQSQISATSRFDIQQWDSDRIPVILKINDEFDVSYIQNVGGKVGSQIADIGEPFKWLHCHVAVGLS